MLQLMQNALIGGIYFCNILRRQYKKKLTWKIVSWFESWHNGHIYVRN